VHVKADILFVGVAVQMVHPGGVERRGPAFNAMDLVTLFNKNSAR
jgi:hypothetical protein